MNIEGMPQHQILDHLYDGLYVVDQERKNVVMVPNEALQFQPARTGEGKPSTSATPAAAKAGEERKARGPRVFTLENGKLVRHEVKTGLSDGVNSELKLGELKEGQEVVLAALTGAASTARRSSGGGNRGGGGGGRPPGMRMF